MLWQDAERVLRACRAGAKAMSLLSGMLRMPASQMGRASISPLRMVGFTMCRCCDTSNDHCISSVAAGKTSVMLCFLANWGG